MLVNKVSPASLCPQQETATPYDHLSQRQPETVLSGSMSDNSQLSQYSQTSLDLFSQPLLSSQSQHVGAGLGEGLSGSEGEERSGRGRERNRVNCGNQNSENTQLTAVSRQGAPATAQKQPSKYYMKYISLPSISASHTQGGHSEQKQQLHCSVAHTAISKASYEAWLSKRQERTECTKAIADTVTSTTKGCVKEIGSIIEDLRSQILEQLNKSNSMEESRQRKEHESLIEQQRAIFTQLIQGQLQLQQELACIKQTTAKVCDRIQSLESTLNGFTQAHIAQCSSLHERIESAAQQALHTPSLCCHYCQRRLATDCSNCIDKGNHKVIEQQMSNPCAVPGNPVLLAKESSIAVHPQMQRLEKEDQRVPGESLNTSGSEPAIYTDDASFFQQPPPAKSSRTDKCSSEDSVCCFTKEIGKTSSQLITQSPHDTEHSPSQTISQGCSLKQSYQTGRGQREAKSQETPSSGFTSCDPRAFMTSPTHRTALYARRPARGRKVQTSRRGGRKGGTVGRAGRLFPSRPRTPIVTRARSKRPHQCSDSSDEEQYYSKVGITTATKRANFGVSRPSAIIDDCVFLTSPLLRTTPPALSKQPLSSFQRSSEAQRRRALISQSMTTGSKEVMREIASSLKAQLQKNTLTAC